MKRAIIFLNGYLQGNKEFYHNYIAPQDTIFCADGGARYAYQLNLMPDLILGDLDSLDEEIIEFYKKHEVNFEEFPVEKDKSDTELLLETVINKDYDEIILLAALGKRFDHALANLYLLEGYFKADQELKIVTPNNYLKVIKDKKTIRDKTGQTVSFLPLSKKVEGVLLKGFKYELENGDLVRGQTLGLSNLIQSDAALVEIKEGTLLMIINN